MKKGTLVYIKTEWLNPDEAQIPHVVTEDRGDHSLIRPLPEYFRKHYPHTSFIPTEDVWDTWLDIIDADSIPPLDEEEAD